MAFTNLASTCRFILSFTLLLVTTGILNAQTPSFSLQTEASLTLSISQEAEEAIDRAQRWLTALEPATNRIDLLLQRYALADPSGAPFPLYRCDITPLEQAMPPEESVTAITNLTQFIETERPSMKRLFALQRDLPLYHPIDNWRETITLSIINAQKVDQKGGHWGSRDETIWAVLALRALLNESVPVRLVE